MSKIKVLLVDDQRILPEGLKAILETDPEIEVIGIRDNGKTALLFLESNAPDVILMDIRMPEMNGVDCTKHINQRYPHISVLMLTTFDDRDYIEDALKNGACGYLLKDISGEKLIAAVKDAAKGDTILPSRVAARLLSNLKVKKKTDRLKDTFFLTERENEIAVMISQGYTNKQIAGSLYISEGTVKNYVSVIYEKLGTNDRTGAAIKIKEYI
ncbi:MAG: DNA-binding response regulator [Clostridiales bacterium 43-6]|nr:MAG: DNA-binding response regulator [Clostridiales bacterium 43-6]